MGIKDGCPIDRDALRAQAIRAGRPPVAERYQCQNYVLKNLDACAWVAVICIVLAMAAGIFMTDDVDGIVRVIKGIF